jgi:hypothetical protein
MLMGQVTHKQAPQCSPTPHHKSQGKEGLDFFSSGYNFHETIKVDTLLSITKNKKIEKISQVSLSSLA